MTRRRWTGREIQLLTERYFVEGPVRLAQELDRSEDSISGFARRCGLRTMRHSYGRRADRAGSQPDKNLSGPN